MSSPVKPVAPSIRISRMMGERKNARHNNWFGTVLHGTSIDNRESASATRGTKLKRTQSDASSFPLVDYSHPRHCCLCGAW